MAANPAQPEGAGLFWRIAVSIAATVRPVRHATLSLRCAKTASAATHG
jgi:hypothetical protein